MGIIDAFLSAIGGVIVGTVLAIVIGLWRKSANPDSRFWYTFIFHFFWITLVSAFVMYRTAMYWAPSWTCSSHEYIASSESAMAASGHIETGEVLIEAGADVNAKATNGSTALIIAAGGGHTETVKALLDAGADVNAKDYSGFTALSWVGDQTEIAEILRQAGATQ